MKNPFPKGVIGIGGAVVLAVVMILAALYVKPSPKEVAEGAPVVASGQKTRIETLDTDGNGIKDWEEDLRANLFESIETPTSTIQQDNDYVPPATLTGRFSEALFQDYLTGKLRGQDMTDTSELVSNAVTAIEEYTQSKKYTRLDVRAVESTPTTVRDYGNAVASIIAKFSIDNENEMQILGRALKEDDPKILKDLEPIREVYKNMVRESLLIPVPENLVEDHLALLSAYEAVITDIEAMQAAFTDPLLSLARVRYYERDVTAMYEAFKNIYAGLKNQGAVYANEEPGAFFYLFES